MSEEEKTTKDLRQQMKEWLDSQDFYEMMQVYRTAFLGDQARVVAAFEYVKVAILGKVDEFVDDKRDYITVYKSIGGWKAVHVTWSVYPEGGLWEPEQTGIGAYATPEEAVREAQGWAESEGLVFRPPRLES